MRDPKQLVESWPECFLLTRLRLCLYLLHNEGIISDAEFRTMKMRLEMKASEIMSCGELRAVPNAGGDDHPQ